MLICVNNLFSCFYLSITFCNYSGQSKKEDGRSVFSAIQDAFLRNPFVSSLLLQVIARGGE